MASTPEDRFKRPLYVYDLPPDVLSTLQLQDQSSSTAQVPSDEPAREESSDAPKDDAAASGPSCSLCHVALADPADRRRHVKSDWHRYNLKQKLRSLPPVDEPAFDRLIGELDESISGSDSSASEDSPDEGGGGSGTALSQLLKKQARLSERAAAAAGTGDAARKPHRSPLLWFTSPALPPKTALGVYRALLTPAELAQPGAAAALAKKQLPPKDGRALGKGAAAAAAASAAAADEPSVLVCMIGGGHFAAMVVSLAAKVVHRTRTGGSEREAIVLAHKTFHRYTTRRKQGGAQGASDAAKGAAHSAGASIRRANEVALEAEVRQLLAEWKGLIDRCDLLFVRATGATNRRTLFGPYDKQVLRAADPRLRSIPFTTRRATQAELMRAFVELTRAKLGPVREPEAEPDAKAPGAEPAAPPKKAPPKLSPEEEAALLHTSQLQALIKRSKVPALLQYLSANSLSPDFRFHPPSSATNRHAPTPLHLASSSNSPVVVQALLAKAGADPTVQSDDGKAAFEVAGDRATRDEFRVARSELGEAKWAWDAARVPPPLSKGEARAREKAEQTEATTKESERRGAELKRLAAESEAKAAVLRPGGRTLAKPETTAADRREEELRGLTPEQKTRLERERRARAAEERMRRMAGP